MIVRFTTIPSAEVCSLNIRRSLLLTVAVPLLFVGCGKSEAKFVTSERTQDLHSDAEDAVEVALAEHFGDPQDLVAWMKLPIDFGQYSGAVVGGVEQSLDQIQVTLEVGSDQTDRPANALTSEDLTRMALLWTSGKYRGLTDDEGNLFNFRVRNYQPSRKNSFNGTLSLEFIDFTIESPPEPGDTFLLVGNEFQQGRRLYMEHCMHCHGVSGDGNGPTAPYLNPRPRDYRLGTFKFTSTQRVNKASRDDLKRTVRKGIPGTYMPSFLLLEDDELKAIIEYVRWLAIRGEFEKFLVEGLKLFSDEEIQKSVERGEEKAAIEQELKDYLAEDFIEGDFGINEAVEALESQWKQADEVASIVSPKLKRPESTQESIARGRALFLSGEAQCYLCHGVTGRGNGKNNYGYNKNTVTNQEYDEPGLFDDWGNPIKPRDLTRGIYRGGRRPLDIYRRIYVGIKGTPMPPGKLSEQQIWDLVNYVMSIPYESR